MLIIRRRPGESVVLTGGIEVVMLDSSVHGVKLGFKAPMEVTVLRKEIWLAQKSNREAADSAREETIGRLISSLQLQKGGIGSGI